MTPERVYACPDCGTPVDANEGSLRCSSCGSTYPDRGGFYDFLGDGSPENHGMVSLFDAVSRVYETPLWYPTGMRLATGGRASVDELVEGVAERIGEEGIDNVLDVATGTGLFARRLARAATVYGVDASEGMLRRAVRKARRDGVVLELARGDATSLPYADDSFDAVTCCGALHILPDPDAVLRESGRVVRSGGRLVVTTLVDSGVMSPSVVQRAAGAYGVRVFGNDELDAALNDAGFERIDAETRLDSSLVTLVARRR